MLATMTKHSPTRATEAYISIIAHITITELQRKLDETAMANGFANRFLLGCVRRAQLLPHGGNFQERDRQLLGKRTLEALTAARTIARVQMTEETRERWYAEYPALVKSGTNLTDHMTARAEAQVIRLALTYALLDQATTIELAHLEPALALWRFCQASTRYIFGELTGDAVGDVILRALKQAGSDGLTKTDIINLFGRHLAVSKIDSALARLQAAGNTISQRTGARPGIGGRPREMWYAK
jgi:DNA replicative helicase MCM subunit Mcm2 (Cdc46/Mcm family)